MKRNGMAKDRTRALKAHWNAPCLVLTEAMEHKSIRLLLRRSRVVLCSQPNSRSFFWFYFCRKLRIPNASALIRFHSSAVCLMCVGGIRRPTTRDATRAYTNSRKLFGIKLYVRLNAKKSFVFARSYKICAPFYHFGISERVSSRQTHGNEGNIFRICSANTTMIPTE